MPNTKKRRRKLAKSRIELIVPVAADEETCAPDWDGRWHYPDHRAVPLTFETVVWSGNTKPPHYCLAFEARGRMVFTVALRQGADVRIFMSEHEALQLYGHLDAQLPEAAKASVRKLFHAAG